MGTNLHFDEEKAAQVAAFILRLDHHAKINKLRLVKLLYLVDREALKARARPVIGGTYYSMPHGTVISEAVDSMSLGNEGQWTIWGQHFKPEGSTVIAMIADPGDDLLSKNERTIIERVYQQFGKMTPFQIRDYTHTLPEYEDPHGSSNQIPLVSLLQALGRTRQDATRIANEIKSVQFMAGIDP